MLGLPKSTDIVKLLPKKAIYQKFGLKASQREHFDSDISKMTIVNAISQSTLPALQKGERVDTIYVIEVLLKKKDYDPQNIQLLTKLIPQKMLFALHFQSNVKLAICHTKLLTSTWASANSYKLNLSGTTMDLIWENLVKDIGNIHIERGNTLTEQIVINDERDKLLKQIETLEFKARLEKQPRRKLEMFEELRELEKILNR